MQLLLMLNIVMQLLLMLKMQRKHDNAKASHEIDKKQTTFVKQHFFRFQTLVLSDLSFDSFV